jgi:cobalt-zinc-cadmium resistance protein CzcA
MKDMDIKNGGDWMIGKIIEYFLKQRLLVVLVFLIIVIAGIFSISKLPIDAFPDVSPSLVQVFLEAPGLAPEEIERLAAYPIEVAMNGLPKIKVIRSVSRFGLAIVNVYFEDDVDIYFARQLVFERLQVAKENIPEGLGSPEMGPISTGMGQILLYTVEGEGYDNIDLRTVQDWIVKFNLQTLPGVTEVISHGGGVKQYQVKVDPDRLIKYDLTINEVVETVKENNKNVGASYIEKREEEYIVRGMGLAKQIQDIEDTVITSYQGTPVYVKDVGKVEFGQEARRGTAVMDGKGETVVGVVLKLIGENTSKIVNEVKERLEEINKILPEGVKLVSFYDQSSLVGRCISTVRNALLLGIILVGFVLLLFIGNLPGVLIVALSLPFSILLAFILLRQFGISGNLMSLGGLAIGMGMMVDASIVIVENVYRHLQRNNDKQPVIHVVMEACKEIGRPIFFAISIIIIVFIPLFTLQGVEGKLFKPLAYTISMAMISSLIFSLAIAPVFCSLILKRKSRNIRENPVTLKLINLYKPILKYFVLRKWLVVCISVILIVSGALVFRFLGKEFIPTLDEGSIQILAFMDPTISLSEATNHINKLEKEILVFPEVTKVVAKVGQGEVGPHSHPVNFAGIFIDLKPKKLWETAKTKEDLVNQLSEHLSDFPGVMLNFSQPIQHSIDELVTGIRAQLALKLFGDDFNILLARAKEIKEVISSVKGAADVQLEQVTGQPQLQIKIDRRETARFGVKISDVLEIIEVAIGGTEAGKIYEEQKTFDIFIRFDEEHRDDIDTIKNLLIDTPGDSRIPLSQLAKIDVVTGYRQISRENGQRFITIQCNVRGRDIGGFVKETREKVGEIVKLPPGYLTLWGGQFELQQAANRRLSIVIPFTLLLIFIILFSTFNSLRHALLILINIPLAVVGGIFALKIFGLNLSVPSSVGFIALFGIAIENGLVLISYFNQLRRQGMSLEETIITGATMRLRPVLMTASTTALGLLPLVIATGPGSEIQKPLATVVIGGLITSTILTLIVLPILYGWSEKYEEAVEF